MKIINIIISILAVISFSVHAGCAYYANYNRGSINFPNISVARDAHVGDTLATAEVKFSVDGYYNMTFKCSPDGGQLYYKMTYNNGIASSIANVYNTNIPGIGIRINFYASGIYYNNPATVRAIAGTGSDHTFGVRQTSAELVKIGPVTSGTLQTGVATSYYGDDGVDGSNIYIDSATQVTSLACSLNTPNSMSFPLGNIPASEFSNTSIGTASTEKNTQNIQLSCDSGVNVNVSLTGQQNPETTDASVLALSGSSSGSQVASGLGVQILYNSTPLTLGQEINITKTTTSEEQVNIALTARYVQTSNTVKAGQANATATLNITYQ